MLFAIIISFTIGLMFGYALEKEETTCPNCGRELTDRGFEGWKKYCRWCHWSNTGGGKV